MASVMFHFYFLILYATFLFPIFHCQGKICLLEKHVALFIFGDSLYDPGNNNYINTTTDFQANFGPYGEIFFKYPTGRFSDGRLIPDFIAEYAKLPIITTYLHPGYHRYTDGANFASGGAGALVGTHQGYVVDLHTQLSLFKNLGRQFRGELGDAEAKTLLGKAVYLINIGGNDYLVPYNSNSTVLQYFSREEYVDMVIGNLTIVIKEIYKKGGRKFGFLSMPPLGCFPFARILKPENNGSCMEEIGELVKLHNKALPKALQELEHQLIGFKYSIANGFAAFGERINNPSNYGFKEGKTACCGSGPYRGLMSCGGKRSVKGYELCENANEYVFFDFAHPSETANEQFAKIMWSGTLNVTGPYNLKALFQL